jgi:dimethylamine monooxygenase subunit A
MQEQRWTGIIKAPIGKPFDLNMTLDSIDINTPFRMQPGLRRMAEGEPHVHALRIDSALWHEKNAVVQARQALHAVPGFDPEPALNAIYSIANSLDFTGAISAFDSQDALALSFEEDFAVLLADGTVPWMCVCAPSHWAPEDKVGQSLTQIHAPVADGEAIRAAAPALARLVTGGARWARSVWTISPSNRHDQHPRRHARVQWPDTQDPEAFAQACWLRSEQQTFIPVRHDDGRPAGQSVFTIRVQLTPLEKAVRNAEHARVLYNSLTSMSDAVVAYKGLTDARPRLLAGLERLAN